MSAKELIIHCGTYKTGSSSLQNYLYSDSESQGQYGFLYAKSGLFTKEPDVGFRHSLLLYSSEWQKYCNDLVSEVLESNRTVVVSSEAYSRAGSIQKLRYLVQECRANGIIVKGIIYIRNYFDYICSFYREMTQRRGNKRDLPDFFKTYSNGAFNYYLIANQLLSIFGSSNIHFFPYKKGMDIVNHFYRFNGFELSSTDKGLQNFKSNPSISALETEVVRIFNSRELFEKDKNKVVIAKDFIENNMEALIKEKNFIEDLGFIKEPSDVYKNKLNQILGWRRNDLDHLYVRPSTNQGELLNADVAQRLVDKSKL